jgi:SAM-dependent methyltransferase
LATRERDRDYARQIAHRHLAAGDALGWFEELYASASGEASRMPWADLFPNPNVIEWLNREHVAGSGRRALDVGCGLGDDAEELARRGFHTTAFDISPTAIAWCHQRFPETAVRYVVADLFDAGPGWQNGFDFVLESYTLQVLPPELRQRAVERIAAFVAPGGLLLVIARAREPEDPAGQMPWPLTAGELHGCVELGLAEESFEDYTDRNEEPPVRRFRAVYRAPG